MGKAGAKPMTKGALAKAIATEKHCRHCDERGEEGWRLHDPWLVPHQDPNETSHKGRSEEHFRQRGEGQSKASKDDREGIPSCCIEEANLESPDACFDRYCRVLRGYAVRESCSAGLRFSMR